MVPFGRPNSKKMSIPDHRLTHFASVVSAVAQELGIVARLEGISHKRVDTWSILGERDEREGQLRLALNELNEYIVKSNPESTKTLRFMIVDLLPKLLMVYQSLRFPQIFKTSSVQLPTKVNLEPFPGVIHDTGLFLPVSTCLRLLAVSLSDVEAKNHLIDCGNLKSIVSHMVDDPLNPLQRESAVFVVKVLTTDFPRGQEEISKLMSPSSS